MDEMLVWAKSVGAPTLMLIVAICVVAKFALGNVLATMQAENETNRKTTKDTVEGALQGFTNTMTTARREYIESLRVMREDYLASLEVHADAIKKLEEEHARTTSRFIAAHENAQRELLSMVALLKGVRRPEQQTPLKPKILRPLPPDHPPQAS